MKTLNAKILTSPEIDWASLDSAMIDTYRWGDDYKPEAGAQVAIVLSGDEHEGLYVHLWCVESNPRAMYKNHNESVYRDSCLEIFFTFNAPNKPRGGYVNIESNSNPTTLIAYGIDRHDRKSIVDMGIEPFDVRCEKTPTRWDLYEFVPMADLKRIFNIDKIDEQTEMWANFYKCGEETEVEHFGSWAPIDSPAPDFHRPEAFGRILLSR